MGLFGKKKKEIDSDKRRALTSRLSYIERAMDGLIRDHLTPDSLEELYHYILEYAPDLSSAEIDYCKHILRTRAYHGYTTYDDDRLR